MFESSGYFVTGFCLYLSLLLNSSCSFSLPFTQQDKERKSLRLMHQYLPVLVEKILKDVVITRMSTYWC